METFSALLAILQGIHRSPVNSPHKGQWCGALIFSLIFVWINGWVNNREAGDLRRYRAHYDVSVMHPFDGFVQERLTPLLMHWIYVFLALTHHIVNPNFMKRFQTEEYHYPSGISKILTKCKWVNSIFGGCFQTLETSVKISPLPFPCCQRAPTGVNTSRPKKHGPRVEDSIFKCIFLSENSFIFIEISLKIVHMGSIDNNLALVQIMAWFQTCTKPLSDPIMSYFTDANMCQPASMSYINAFISTLWAMLY